MQAQNCHGNFCINGTFDYKIITGAVTIRVAYTRYSIKYSIILQSLVSIFLL